jgi:NADPH:quinone reductase-like Zn-dependent oxidoreductase
MKAISREKYGSPDILMLREIERPVPRENEVRVKVLAASVNKADWYLLLGKPLPARLMTGLIKPKYKVLGADVAGFVEQTGSAVTQFKPGDEVFGDLSADGFGAFAEYVTADEQYLAKKPGNLTYEETAALPMAAVTALQGLRDKGKLRAGQHVLINGASGGVGGFAIQIAKALGAEVTAVCSTQKAGDARKQGADRVIDYHKADVTQAPYRYDLIFDVVGNHSILAISQLLKPKGTYVACNFSPGALLLGPWIKMSQGKHITSLMARPKQADLQYIAKLAEEQKIKPLIAQCYTLDDLADALRTIGKGGASGKLVISL